MTASQPAHAKPPSECVKVATGAAAGDPDCSRYPRVRGTLSHPPTMSNLRRFIPARAGNAFCHLVGAQHGRCRHLKAGKTALAVYWVAVTESQKSQ